MSEDYISSTVINLDGDKLYPVEKIVGKRLRKGKVEYLVRWKNYSEDTDSWEPSKALHKTCHPLIKEFNKDPKFLPNNNSVQTSTESSNDTSILGVKDSEKLSNHESNLKSQVSYTNTKSMNSEISSIKSKSKENVKSSNLTERHNPEINEKRQFLHAKLSNGAENIEKAKLPLKANNKDCPVLTKTNPHDIINKNIVDYGKSAENTKNTKKVLYLEDINIVEPFVPKTKISFNGVSSNCFVKRSPLPLVTSKSQDLIDLKSSASISKSLTDLANNLKRKSISVVNGNQKKTKLSDKESKINPISVIENDQIQNLKKLMNNNVLDYNSNGIKYKNLKCLSISKLHLASEEKMEKYLKNLPHQRYKESDYFDSSDPVETRRTSVRQIEAANRFREIIVRKNVSAGFTEICLHNSSHSFPNSFNIKILNELHIALKQAINDSSRVILLSAIGSVFSSGIDLESIISSSQKCISNVKPTLTTTAQLTTTQFPNQHIHDFAECLKKFLLELLHFPKPVVVGINGPAIGLGCAILPLCDLIYATESSSFYLPYTALSQIPEAGSSLTLPMLVGMPTANQLLLCGRKWSAKEALNRGLISEIIFSEKFKPELFSRCEKLAHVPSMNSETMKCMLRIHYKEQIDLAINMECRKLVEIWKSNEFRNSAQSFLDNELPNLLL